MRSFETPTLRNSLRMALAERVDEVDKIGVGRDHGGKVGAGSGRVSIADGFWWE